MINSDFAELIDTAYPVWKRAFSKNEEDWAFSPDESKLVNDFVLKCVLYVLHERADMDKPKIVVPH